MLSPDHGRTRTKAGKGKEERDKGHTDLSPHVCAENVTAHHFVMRLILTPYLCLLVENLLANGYTTGSIMCDSATGHMHNEN